VGKKNGTISKKFNDEYMRFVGLSKDGKNPLSVICIDSQSVKTGKAGVDRGYDGGTKGSKDENVIWS